MTQAIGSFFSKFWHSIYDLPWVRAQRGQSTLGYLFLLVLVGTVIGMGSLWPIPREARQIWKDVTRQVPDFTATLAGGELTVEKIPQPYVYKGNDNGQSFLLYVDTVSTSSLDVTALLAEQSSENAIIVTRTEARIYQNQGIQTKDQTIRFSEFPNTSFTREQAIAKVNQIVGWVLPFIFFLILVVMYIALLIGALVAIVIAAAFVRLIVMMAKRSWTFSELFSLGAYAITGPLLLVVILRNGFGMTVPFLRLLLLVLFLLLVVFGSKDEPAVSSSTTPPVIPPPQG